MTIEELVKSIAEFCNGYYGHGIVVAIDEKPIMEDTL